jgi:hypothetical protein
MASGQIFSLLPVPPGQKYAVESEIIATTTATGDPYQITPTWTMDAATAAYMDFYGQLQGYGGGGLTAAWDWLVTTTATTTVVFGGAFRRMAAGEDLTAAHTFDANFATEAGQGTVAAVATDNMTFSDGADMDSVADGEPFVFRFFRNATATGDAITTNVYLGQTLTLFET